MSQKILEDALKAIEEVLPDKEINAILKHASELLTHAHSMTFTTPDDDKFANICVDVKVISQCVVDLLSALSNLENIIEKNRSERKLTTCYTISAFDHIAINALLSAYEYRKINELKIIIMEVSGTAVNIISKLKENLS